MRYKTRVKQKQFRKKQARDIFYIVFCATVAATIGYRVQHTHPVLYSPIVKAHAQDTAIPTLTQVPATSVLVIYDSNKYPTQDEIDAYIRRIFLDQADTAIGISHHECPIYDQNYPACVLHTSAEYSVGVFQINLYNSEQNIHADRIPGTTMDEKIEWLKNPFNNTLYAWWVYSTSGFSPWSTYTSGAYLE